MVSPKLKNPRHARVYEIYLTNYFLIVVSAGLPEVSVRKEVVSTGAVNVSGETVEGDTVVVSALGVSLAPLSLQAAMKPATAKIANSFFILIAF